jgi:hypothetical protein
LNKYILKTCLSCGEDKTTSEFHKDKKFKDGVKSRCKKCKAIELKEYQKTLEGVITSLYSSQRSNSKVRKHNPPGYSKDELKEWLLKQDKFNNLFIEWEKSGYFNMLKPSIDRLDDSKGYSFDNIMVMTWGENKQKGHDDIRNGKLRHGVNPQKAIIQYDIHDNIVKEFVSAHSAHRDTLINRGSISACCRGERNTAGGYKWSFKDV